MAKLLQSNNFLRSSSTLKMYPFNSCDTVRYPLTIKCLPQNTNSAGSPPRVGSSTKHQLRGQPAVNVAADNTNNYTQADLRLDNVPKHVAIILDGNRRWLKARDKPLISYEPFFEANLVFADLCIKWGILTATSFVYSLKNLERGQEANDLLFGQLEIFLEQNRQQFIRKGIRMKVIGERTLLPQTLQWKITEVEEATRECTNLEFMLAVCYAGTRDIVQATKSVCEKVKNGVIEVKAIDEALLESELSTGGSRAPQIDLLIRTGGRLRVSDYLMWQMAQAELYFSNVYAPDFDEVEFAHAIHSFQLRERTFGN
ncbi:uncharacterized protein LOC141606989 [Silene latifolia]|uniref:uncharacterized protein LOC141606989 n=1 Tax=Silene latifolia TaxID=37657 RepID=UPI003D777E17